MRPQALQNLRTRRNPENALLKEAYARLDEDDAVKYLVGAMEPIDPAYSRKTFEEGDRVKNQIVTGLAGNGLSAEYEYQGSSVKNTQIRAYSDLDLLVLEARFYSLEPPQTPTQPYLGNPIDDLLQIRRICRSTLTSAFPKADIDDSGPRSVKISGGSLSRTVDVVPANWYDTNRYAQTRQKIYRGIHVLNAPTRQREPDEPFIHAALIDQKDGRTLGNTRKLVRLLKSLKYDSDGKVTISSFDIESIVYRMEDGGMRLSPDQDIQLAGSCWLWLRQIKEDANLRQSLLVPDEKRAIFAQGKATLAQLEALEGELAQLMVDIDQGLKRSFRKLAEARIKIPS
jgi:hypothetical protein